MHITYSDQYLKQINEWQSSDGLKKQVVLTTKKAERMIAKNFNDEEYRRPYLDPFKKIILGQVPPPRDEFGIYCLFYQIEENQEIGIQRKKKETIIHFIWVNNDHFPHNTRSKHKDWSTDPCVCRFLELKNRDELEVFDKDVHFGVFEIINNIGDDFFHVKLSLGPKKNSKISSVESIAQVSVYFELSENKIYRANILHIEGADRFQGLRLLDVLTDELLEKNLGIEFVLWSPMQDELELMQNICRSLSFNEDVKEDVYYFSKNPLLK